MNASDYQNAYHCSTYNGRDKSSFGTMSKFFGLVNSNRKEEKCPSPLNSTSISGIEPNSSSAHQSGTKINVAKIGLKRKKLFTENLQPPEELV